MAVAMRPIAYAATTSTTAVAIPVPTSAPDPEDPVDMAALGDKVPSRVFVVPAG